MGTRSANQKSCQVLLLGLEKAGKSLFAQKLAEVQQGRPYETTRGFNVLNLNIFDRQFEVWDVGGDPLARAYWPTFYRKVQFNLVVFFIDLLNDKTHPAALKELLVLVNQEELKLVRFFVIFNLKKVPNVSEEEQRDFAESRMDELRMCPVHDFDSRVFWDVVDVSSLKAGEIKTNDLLSKCLLGNADRKFSVN